VVVIHFLPKKHQEIRLPKRERKPNRINISVIPTIKLRINTGQRYIFFVIFFEKREYDKMVKVIGEEKINNDNAKKT